MSRLPSQSDIESLRKTLAVGDTLYTVLRHVSRSGMYRVIDVLCIEANQPRRISWAVANALGWRYDMRHEGIGVSGAGMDMGFHLIYSLSRVLFPNGHHCTGQQWSCPSNDHTNGMREYNSATIHPDGGYALNQKWL